MTFKKHDPTKEERKAKRIEQKKLLAENFPDTGKVRAADIAAFLRIGVSSWWLHVKEGRVMPPMKLGVRTSVWDAQYIRELAANGIPNKSEEAA